MDAWGELLQKSTAPAGSDAWEHLISVSPGGGGIDFTAIAGIEVEINLVETITAVTTVVVAQQVDTVSVVTDINIVSSSEELTEVVVTKEIC